MGRRAGAASRASGVAIGRRQAAAGSGSPADVFVMDVDNSPLFGFDGLFETAGADGTIYTKSYQATGGPNGTPCVQYAFIPQGSAGQVNFGFIKNLAAPAQGTMWAMAYWLKIHSGFNVPTSHWGDKLYILGQGGVDSKRMMTIGAPRTGDTDFAVKASLNIEGPPNATTQVDISVGSWHAIQVKNQSGSTTTSTDGSIKLYIDNDVEGSPTASATTMDQSMPTTDWNSIIFGNYSDVIVTGETLTISITGFQIGTAFDDTFHARQNT